jgi:hypothetical protein
MKLNRDDLLQKRQALLLQMQSIDRLRRGSLSKQFFQARPPAPPARRGPYFVLQGFFHGKKFSERIPPEQAAQVEQDVENYRRFQALAEEYVTLSDQITRLPDQPQESKKNSSRRRSPTNSSRKPPPS